MLYKLKYIWENTFLSFTSILRILFLSKFMIKQAKKTKYDSCVILGNGPSLNDFLKNDIDFLKDKATLCVNYFIRSEEDYLAVKPNYYLITSPEFWRGEEKKGWVEDRMIAFKMMAELTDWKLVLFVPLLAKKRTGWRKELDQNENISINYFNNIPVEGFEVLRHWAYRNNLAMPRPHNVLAPSILSVINLQYQNIFLAGTDHSWLKELSVNNENRVFLRQKHFYDAKPNHIKSIFSNDKANPLYVGGSKKERKLHEVLEKFYYAFKSYWELRAYADKKNISIINLTENSYIDAFPKYQL